MLQDLFQKIIIMLSLVYGIFFGMEVVLPGVVMSVFNINSLLIAILILIGVGFVFDKDSKSTEQNYFFITRKSLLLGMVYLLVISSISLYKVSLEEMSIYLLMIFILIKILWINQDIDSSTHL